MGFITYLTRDNEGQQERIYVKCALTFILQVTLPFLLMRFYWAASKGDIMSGIFEGNAWVNFARALCALLLHIELLPELQAAKEMLSFGKKNPQAFLNGRFDMPMLFAAFKAIGGTVCFFANVFVILRAITVEYILQGFVSVLIISSIDDMMARAVPIEDRPETMNVQVARKRMLITDWDIFKEHIIGRADIRQQNFEDGTYHQPFTCMAKLRLLLFMIFYRVFSILYHVAWYYFAPFIITFIIIFN